MRKSETAFFVLVFLFAAVFAARTLGDFGRFLGRSAQSANAGEGRGGKARDINAAEMKRQIEEGTLSDHEAEFYKKSPVLVPGASATTPSPEVKRPPSDDAPHAGTQSPTPDSTGL